MSYTRYAVYYLPPDGELASFGAAWLGWDVETGSAVNQPAIEGLPDATKAPRKYGFHATLKPPFRLANGTTTDGLRNRVRTLAEGIPPARCDGLRLSHLGRFLALTPVGETGGIARVAAACVMQLDDFRAPPIAAELARRRAVGLSPRQETLLRDWGYPYVLDEFRLHMTLSGKLGDAALDRWTAVLSDALPPLPEPFLLREIALVGERKDGCFELIQRYTLTG